MKERKGETVLTRYFPLRDRNAFLAGHAKALRLRVISAKRLLCNIYAHTNRMSPKVLSYAVYCLRYKRTEGTR